MSWFSFHGGHSGDYARHARGSLEAVVAAAAARGFSAYGLSEHCPRYRRVDLYPDEQGLEPEDLVRMFADYLVEAARLRELYAGRLEIFIGFETEALPLEDWAPRMARIRSAYPFDFVVGSVHHVAGLDIDAGSEGLARARAVLGGRVALELAYFDQVIELVERLRPEVVGHLDLIRKLEGPGYVFAPEVRARIEASLEAIRAAGSRLDVNAAPRRKGLGPVYPQPWILERARRMGIPVTLGDDSHGPDEVGEGLEACVEAITAAGYHEVEGLVRKEGRACWQALPLGELRPCKA